MPKFVVEQIPGAGKMTQEQLHAISQTSCGVLNKWATNTMGAQLRNNR